jgi:hypothetical protein
MNNYAKAIKFMKFIERIQNARKLYIIVTSFVPLDTAPKSPALHDIPTKNIKRRK